MRRRELHLSTVTTPPHDCPEATESVAGAGSWLSKQHWSIVAVLLVFRILNALLSFTSFAPDEYWQSIEIAHSMVFGYGYRTWEWHKPIRGFTHPLMYGVLYKLLAVFNMDWPCLLIVLPRVLHALLAVASDYHVLKIGTHLFGEKAGRYALYCNIASWFTFYCITRTLSNSIEAALTPVILYHWMSACEVTEKFKVQSHTRLYLLMIGISCLVRPTGAVLWAPLVLAHFFLALKSGCFWCVLKETFIIGLLNLLWSLAVDYYFYGKFVIVQWKFLEFNVLDGHSALFGTHSWHWYFTEDCLVLLFTLLPLCIVGAWWSPSNWHRALFWLALWELLFHSALSHKEHRFVFPIVPVGSIFAGYCIVRLFQSYKHRALHYLVYLLLLANVPMAVYFSLVHQRGTIAVMDYLRKSVPLTPLAYLTITITLLVARILPNKALVGRQMHDDIQSNSSVLFLMPCHSTPYYSHIHQPVKMRFLECPPPIREDYVDIADLFYSNPSQWLNTEYPSLDSAPTHIVLYDVLMQEIEGFLSVHGYREVVRLFHSHFPEPDRCSKYVVLLRRP